MDTFERQRVAALVSEYGYAVVVAPGYAYSAGTPTTWVVAGLDDELSTQVIQRAIRGEQVFAEHDVRYVVADPSTLDLEGARLGTQVFQVLWPDVHGVFPDEDGYAGTEQVLFT